MAVIVLKNPELFRLILFPAAIVAPIARTLAMAACHHGLPASKALPLPAIPAKVALFHISVVQCTGSTRATA